MSLKSVCFLFIQVLISVSAFSQIDSTFKDTVKELIIYEYDTVYLEPDTIRLTNIIVDSIKIEPIKEKKNHPFFSAIAPNSIGISVAPFISGNLRNNILYDSLTIQPLINECFSVQINYTNKKYVFSLGAGFTPFHEKYRLQNPNLDGKEYSDYYNYLILNVMFGRKWTLNNKLFLTINAGCFTDFLLRYELGNTYIPASFIRKFDISIAFTTCLTYKLGRNFELYLSPFYQRSLFIYKKYPSTSFQKMGIGVGFNIVL